MNNAIFRIEKLYIAYNDQYQYRLRLSIPGMPDEFCVVEVSHRGEQQEHYVQDAIYNAISHLSGRLEHRLRNYADEVKRRFGDYDTTRLERLPPRATAPPPEPHRHSFLADVLQRQSQNTSLPDKNQRAMDLLKSKIGEEKFNQLNVMGFFEEQGKHGTFRFHLNTPGGVSLIERKKYGNTAREVEWMLCVQSMAPDLPKGDVILSRWMEWKADEDKFLDTANFRGVKTRDEAIRWRV